jgi:hypothetical protein
MVGSAVFLIKNYINIMKIPIISSLYLFYYRIPVGDGEATFD